MKMTVTFTPATIAAMRRVVDSIGADLDDETLGDAELLAEVALDADRLTTCADAPDADREISDLVAKHGWTPVCKAAAKVLGAYSR